MSKHYVIGLMSGTSMDGLDIAFCEFSHENSKWFSKIIHADTIEFPTVLLEKIKNAPNLSGENLFKLHNELGRFFGIAINEFIFNHKIHPQLIASHGHTIFHQPINNFTCQIGSGAEIASTTGIDTVCDFRTTDVALGGQGAPLVPIGDELLFQEYDFCLNLGGIANISTNYMGTRIAWDICSANMLLNYFANQIGFEYDNNGEIAKSGKVDSLLLEKLLKLSFHNETFPKSLGREYVFENYLPLILSSEQSINNILCTLVEMIALLIKDSTKNNPKGRIFTTGGGAFNKYLMERFNHHGLNIYLPDNQIISYKEAMIFAFIGLLRKLEQTNVLKSVTGSSRNNLAGAIYSGK